ncbi:hypothetical protein SAMN05518669_1311, partial [Variovorax sp. YR634]
MDSSGFFVAVHLDICKFQKPPPKQKPPVISDWGFLGCKSLTMTYFHTGTRTI